MTERLGEGSSYPDGRQEPTETTRPGPMAPTTPQTEAGRELLNEFRRLKPEVIRENSMAREFVSRLPSEIARIEREAAAGALPSVEVAIRSIHRQQEGLRRLHPITRTVTDYICSECDRPWPCDTMMALDRPLHQPGRIRDSRGNPGPTRALPSVSSRISRDKGRDLLQEVASALDGEPLDVDRLSRACKAVSGSWVDDSQERGHFSPVVLASRIVAEYARLAAAPPEASER